MRTKVVKNLQSAFLYKGTETRKNTNKTRVLLKQKILYSIKEVELYFHLIYEIPYYHRLKYIVHSNYEQNFRVLFF